MITAIIQARMGSSRYPGKMLEEVKGKPLVLYALEQTSKAKKVEKVLLASTDTDKDKPLLKTAEEAGYDTFAGDEQDVLDRYYQAAKEARADVIVRITGDCPLLDPSIIDKVIKAFLDNDCDYASNVLPPTYPDGLDVEVFSLETLEKVWQEAKKTSDREHVTTYIRFTNKEGFKTVNVENDEDLSKVRWTVDEKEDLELVRLIVEKLGDQDITIENVLRVFREHPELQDVNSKYYRNIGYERSLEKDNHGEDQ